MKLTTLRIVLSQSTFVESRKARPINVFTFRGEKRYSEGNIVEIKYINIDAIPIEEFLTYFDFSEIQSIVTSSEEVLGFEGIAMKT